MILLCRSGVRLTAANNAPQGPHKVVHLTGTSTAYGIGDTNAVYTNFVDGAIECKEIDQIGSE